MANRTYLNFREANCKNCYKCLRECPVKAITVIGDQARIRDELCLLCGHCANVCRFNAKEVVDDRAAVKKLLQSGRPVVASVAPAFAASFTSDFAAFSAALKKLGFAAVEETARGARAVTAEYRRLLESKKYKNLIASACPAIVRLVQIYYPKALAYLAPVDSPMVAHARLLRAELGKDAAIVFLGPCIAKKREADESKLIDAALTFEELAAMFAEADIELGGTAAAETACPDFSALAETGATANAILPDRAAEKNKARYYPINRGIIKSFTSFTEGYEYISVDGVARAEEVLANIDTLSGMFIEMHACEFSCINGPCALQKERGGFIKATETIRAYAKNEGVREPAAADEGKFAHVYKAIPDVRVMPPEYEIRRILEATGKFAPEDELNCGACGYNTCRDKAVAVYNGMAQLEMCVPYMRERAEGLSYDIIQNSPNGILAVDDSFRITEINDKAAALLGIGKAGAKGELLEQFYNPTDFYLVLYENAKVDRKKTFIEKTGAWVEMTVRRVQNQNTLFCIMKDITQDTDYRNKMGKLKAETLETTNEVIDKQMRVVQEIASLLGETAAETKVALIKLKETVSQESGLLPDSGDDADAEN